MEFTDEQMGIAKRLSYGAELFRKFYHKDDSFQKQFEDNFQALVCFFENYAYERQGAAPAYPEIALTVLKNKFNNITRTITIEDARAAWRDYKEIAESKYNGLRVNKTHNPMNSDSGLLALMAKRNIPNLATYTRNLTQNRQTEAAHTLIDDIRGIGTKIASLYLRDIVYLAKIPEETITDQYYLQPVDTWIEQTLSIIFGKEKPKTLVGQQEVIVELCQAADVSPIAFSQGAWMLGSEVAGDYSTFQQLAKGQNAKAIIKEHFEEMERYVSYAKQWLQNWPE